MLSKLAGRAARREASGRGAGNAQQAARMLRASPERVAAGVRRFHEFCIEASTRLACG